MLYRLSLVTGSCDGVLTTNPVVLRHAVMCCAMLCCAMFVPAGDEQRLTGRGVGQQQWRQQQACQSICMVAQGSSCSPGSCVLQGVLQQG